jgi:hypothetical protein
MITDSVKEKIRMGWKPLGHFYVDRERVPDLDSLRHEVPSGRIAVITNDIISGSSQVSIIGLPSLFEPRDEEFIHVLANVASYMFEFNIKFDEFKYVTFQFDGSLDEYVNDGVFRCRFRIGQRGSFGCHFGCWDAMVAMEVKND